MKNPSLRKLTYLKLLGLQLEALRGNDAQNTYLIARRRLPVGIVVTNWAFHKAFFKVSHETLGQKIFCVVTSVSCEYRILLSVTEVVVEKPLVGESKAESSNCEKI